MVASLRIALYAMPYYDDFVEKNAEHLQKKITCLLHYLQFDFIFVALIEFLPSISFIQSFIHSLENFQSFIHL